MFRAIPIKPTIVSDETIVTTTNTPSNTNVDEFVYGETIVNPRQDLETFACPEGQVPCSNNIKICYDPSAQYLIDPCKSEVITVGPRQMLASTITDELRLVHQPGGVHSSYPEEDSMFLFYHENKTRTQKKTTQNLKPILIGLAVLVGVVVVAKIIKTNK